MANHLSFDVLSRLLEERIAPEEEARANRHLARCGRCRDEMRWLERIRAFPKVTWRDSRVTTE
jgi:anti-sigma factor RsiW